MCQSKNVSFSVLAAALIVVCAGLAPSTAAAGTVDSTTSGNWVGVYGSQGYILPSYGGAFANPADPSLDTKSLPSYVSSYSYGSGFFQYVWDLNNPSNVTNSRYPQDPANVPGPRTAATAANGGDGTITLNLNHSVNFQMEVYGLDWENFQGGRDITITVGSASVRLDGANGYYTSGAYAIFDVDALAGPLTINIANNNTSSNTTISGIFFDRGILTPEPSTFVLGGLGAVGLALAVRSRRKA